MYNFNYKSFVEVAIIELLYLMKPVLYTISWTLNNNKKKTVVTSNFCVQ